MGVPNMALLKDELISIGGRVGKFSGSVKFDDDLVDDLFCGCSVGFPPPKTCHCKPKPLKKRVLDDLVDDLKANPYATKNGAYPGSGSAKRIKGKVGYKLDDDSDDDDLADDLALFTAIKEKRQDAKVKRAAKKAAMQEAEVKDDDLVDELWKVGGKIGKFSGSISRDDDLVDDLGDAKWQAQQRRKWADNSLTCDSEGNCMLEDELKFEKVKAVAGKAAQRFPGAASKVANKVKSLRGRDDDDDDRDAYNKRNAAAANAALKTDLDAKTDYYAR